MTLDPELREKLDAIETLLRRLIVEVEDARKAAQAAEDAARAVSRAEG